MKTRESALIEFNGSKLRVAGNWYPEDLHLDVDTINVGEDCDNHFRLFADSKLGEDIALLAQHDLMQKQMAKDQEARETHGIGESYVDELRTAGAV